VAPLTNASGIQGRSSLRLSSCRRGALWEFATEVAAAVRVGAGYAPSWQYFSRLLKKPDESIAASKGGGFTDP
jgi:hypothetical protein